MRLCVITTIVAGMTALALGQGRAEPAPAEPMIGEQVDHAPLVMPAERPRDADWVDEAAQPAAGQVAPDPKAAALSQHGPEIRQYIARLTTTMLKPGAWQSGFGMLSDADAARLKKEMEQVNPQEHDELLAAFARQWRVRYGGDFDLADQQAVMAQYVVLSGKRTPEEAIIVSGEVGNVSGGEAKPLSPEQDRHATVVVPGNAPSRQPGMILQMQTDQPGVSQWRLNTPDTLSARRFQQNLHERLAKLIDGDQPWPTDPREAYRLVSYHVLASLNDQPVERPLPQPAAPRPPLQPDKDNPSLDS